MQEEDKSTFHNILQENKKILLYYEILIHSAKLAHV